ncbi:MAG: carboxypeptidase-like regulatory domain-containing protein, partial [Parafilimonas sp.]|nr:carboxypeptidase-like regulatory domain-containing protein [Parafilimonas sp.]
MIQCLPAGNKIPFTKWWCLTLLICMVLCCNSFALHAQQTITGRVASNDTALSGVTIQVKGTRTATQTDQNGNFSISASPTSTLVFSYVGYATQEVAVNNQTTININLQATAGEMNEVVVIGYQTVRRRDLTGATSVVNTSNSNKIIGNSVAEQLQGQTPGVIVRTGGAPGQNATIEIRGVASFTDASPLYVIDGMMADANSTVNTDDIASIQILKDASAAAIYGSRAANGVIIITTKKGRSGPSRINFSARYGIQQIPHKWDVMDASQYLQTVKTQYANSGVDLPQG